MTGHSDDNDGHLEITECHICNGSGFTVRGTACPYCMGNGQFGEWIPDAPDLTDTRGGMASEHLVHPLDDERQGRGEPQTPALPLRVLFVRGPRTYLPERSHRDDAGWDLRTERSYNRDGWQIKSGITLGFNTGLRVAIPTGWSGVLKTRSGMALHGVFVVGGVIDAGYRGEIMVMLHNSSDEPYFVGNGDRIAQLLFVPVPRVEWQQVDKLPDAERGESGFGSSGR